MPTFQDGFIIVAKRECPTCELLEPVYAELAAGEAALSVFSQDDPAFPESLDDVIDDTGLENSYRLDVETVPTLIRWKDGREVERAIGWNKTEWRDLTGVNGLGGDGRIDRRIANRVGDGGLTQSSDGHDVSGVGAFQRHALKPAKGKQFCEPRGFDDLTVNGEHLGGHVGA